MANYIDGFVLPLARDDLDEYRRLVESVGEIWKEHGALDYQEYVSDDLQRAGTGSFVQALGATANEVIIFGWVTFASRESRDLANERVANDPRMPELMTTHKVAFDAAKMAYAGFAPLIKAKA